MLFKRANIAWKVGAGSIVATFLLSLLVVDILKVKESDATIVGLPKPSEILELSKMYSAPTLKALKIDPDNPLNIDFVIDTKDKGDVSPEEASKLIRYFLTGLTVPEDDFWVNLSPYEQNRVIDDTLSVTDVGRDMLAQDYVLKQLISSLTYPESDTGKDYWDTTYEKLMTIAKTINVPVNTFNKVWIVPESAMVYENNNMAVIKDASLDVMLEEDYMAKDENASLLSQGASHVGDSSTEEINKVSSNVMKDVVLPKIKDDVNFGQNFSQLRQLHSALILSKWFKTKFINSFYGEYINKGKVTGVDNISKEEKQKIYDIYVQAFKKGCYDYIKKEYDPGTKQNIQKRYFSGGVAELQKDVRSSAVSEFQYSEALAETDGPTVVVSSNVLVEKTNSIDGIAAMDRRAIETMSDSSAEYTNKLNNEESRQDIIDLRELITDIYREELEKSTVDYHNDVHNKGVELMVHILASRNGAYLSDQDIVVASLAGMLHDFMLRKKSAGATEAPANVEETITQLRAMFFNAKYRNDTSNDDVIKSVVDYGSPKHFASKIKMARKVRDIMSSVDGATINQVFDEVEALIRRTDFNSNKSMNPQLIAKVISIKTLESEFSKFNRAREFANRALEPGADLDAAINEIKAVEADFIAAVNRDDSGLTQAEKESAVAHAQRQAGIEKAFLRAMKNVDQSRRAHVAKIAGYLETADQMSFYVLSEQTALLDVLKGLDNEMPFPVNPASSYPFFFVGVLNEAMAERLIGLRESDYDRLKANVFYCAQAADKAGIPVNAALTDAGYTSHVDHFNRGMEAMLNSIWGISSNADESMEVKQSSSVFTDIGKTISNLSVETKAKVISAVLTPALVLVMAAALNPAFAKIDAAKQMYIETNSPKTTITTIDNQVNEDQASLIENEADQSVESSAVKVFADIVNFVKNAFSSREKVDGKVLRTLESLNGPQDISKLPDGKVKTVLTWMQENGIEATVVGGSVVNMLQGKDVSDESDVDIMINLNSIDSHELETSDYHKINSLLEKMLATDNRVFELDGIKIDIVGGMTEQGVVSIGGDPVLSNVVNIYNLGISSTGKFVKSESALKDLKQGYLRLETIGIIDGVSYDYAFFQFVRLLGEANKRNFKIDKNQLQHLREYFNDLYNDKKEKTQELGAQGLLSIDLKGSSVDNSAQYAGQMTSHLGRTIYLAFKNSKDPAQLASYMDSMGVGTVVEDLYNKTLDELAQEEIAIRKVKDGGINLNEIDVDVLQGVSGIQLKPIELGDFAGFNFQITKLEKFEQSDAMLASFL